MHHLIWVHQISLANSFICQNQPQLCWRRLLLVLECRAESTGAGRQLLHHMQNDSSFKFNHMGWEKYFLQTRATAVKPTKPVVGQKATCPGVSPALLADVTFQHWWITQQSFCWKVWCFSSAGQQKASSLPVPQALGLQGPAGRHLSCHCWCWGSHRRTSAYHWTSWWSDLWENF